MPDVPYGVFSTALLNSVDPPEVLLNKLEQMALESPMMVALVLDEDLDWITLLKNPRQFVGSLVHPAPLDGFMYGFSGPDAHRLAAVHIPTSVFEVSAAYNILDDATAICLGLEGLLTNQAHHPYVNVGTTNMTNSACSCSVLLPIEWHPQFSRNHPYDITLKAFYDIFLSPLQAITGQPYTDMQTWWRHATMCTMLAGARVCLGLQVTTTQALPPALCANCDGWAQELVECILKLL